MGLSNQAGRHKKEYVNDFPDRKIHSWTNGVKAWKRGDSGSSDSVVGWFFPPRHRNKGWKTRKSRSPRPLIVHEEE